jgi:hypothetical protein
MRFSPVIALLLAVVTTNACGKPPLPPSNPATSAMAAEPFAATIQPLIAAPTSVPSPTTTRPAPTAMPAVTQTPLTPTPTSTLGLDRFPAAPANVGWQPLPTPECQALASALAARLRISTTITISVFAYEPETAGSNTGCQISAAATNQILQVANGLELADKVETALTPFSWSLDVDSRYGAAAFSEVEAEYHKGDGLCKLSIVGHAAQATVCPEGLSPTGCFYALPPEQQLYTIQLTCAQSVP